MDNELIKIYEKHADNIIRNMKRFLLQNNRRATGSFINSLGYRINEKGIEFTGSSYGYFIQNGRRPGKQPKIEPILAWMKTKRIRIGNNRSKPIVKKGRNNPPESNLRGMAFIIARSIGRKGTKGTDYLQFIKLEKQSLMNDIKSYYKNFIIKELKNNK